MAVLAKAWFIDNDILVTLSGLQSSTMGGGTFLNASTRVSVALWKTPTTVSTTGRLITGQTMNYSAGSNGNYRYVAYSTSFTALNTPALNGMAIITVNHQNLHGEWRVPFQTQYRQTS